MEPQGQQRAAVELRGRAGVEAAACRRGRQVRRRVQCVDKAGLRGPAWRERQQVAFIPTERQPEVAVNYSCLFSLSFHNLFININYI